MLSFGSWIEDSTTFPRMHRLFKVATTEIFKRSYRNSLSTKHHGMFVVFEHLLGRFVTSGILEIASVVDGVAGSTSGIILAPVLSPMAARHVLQVLLPVLPTFLLFPRIVRCLPHPTLDAGLLFVAEYPALSRGTLLVTLVVLLVVELLALTILVLLVGCFVALDAVPLLVALLRVLLVPLFT